MLNALSKAFAQLSDPAFRKVLIIALLSSVAIFIVLWIIAGALMTWGGNVLLAWSGAEGWMHDAATWILGAGGVVAVLFASFFLFPSIMSLVLSFLLEDVAAAVERRHYPNLPAPRHEPFMEILKGGLAFAGVTILLNVIALPLYLVLLFLPPFNLFVFYALNGYLFGREYFEIVAVRRLDPINAKQLRRQFRWRVFMAGVIIAFLLTIPIVNLITPIVATGFMLHVFETLRSKGAVRT